MSDYLEDVEFLVNIAVVGLLCCAGVAVCTLLWLLVMLPCG